MMGIRVSRTYRTISSDAVAVISGIPPIELLVQERMKEYNGKDKIVAKEEMCTHW